VTCGIELSRISRLTRCVAWKSRAFVGFAKVCQMIGQGDHLRPEGMEEIVRIAYEMNLGKRRHSASALLRTLSEVKG
jgi:hypothetical protein